MMTELIVLKRARDILAANWCAFWSTHPDRVRHCAHGALAEAVAGHSSGYTGFTQHHTRAVRLVNDAARALHPELHGAVADRRENGDYPDRFDDYPVVYVNNHLGRRAILRVFDAAILELELKLAGQAEQVAGPEPADRELVLC